MPVWINAIEYGDTYRFAETWRNPSSMGRSLGTYSRTYGLQASSGTTAAGAQTSSVLGTGVFGRDTNDLTNADGRLPNDRPHALRMMGTVDVPHSGILVAGKPRDRQCVQSEFRSATVFVDPRRAMIGLRLHWGR